MFTSTNHRMGMQPYHVPDRPANFLMPSRTMNVPQRQNGLQSIISKFIKPKAGAGFINTAGTAPTAVTTTAGGITSKLDSMQHILKMVQSTAPLVQEYGPMVKNLPAMYRMMKAFKAMENTDEESTEKDTKEEEDSWLESNPAESEEKIQIKKNTQGLSQPKLYI